MKYPRSNARAFFHHERCPACGSGMIDLRGAERRCTSCGLPTAHGSSQTAVPAGFEVTGRTSFRAGRDAFLPDSD